jgi:AraC-like DNA-binding protein
MTGSAAMLVGDQSLRMRAPTLMILRANVFHGEGSVDDEPYDLLWLGLEPSGACVLAVSTYRPKRGWRVGERQRLGQWSGKHLLHGAGSGQGTDDRSGASSGAASGATSGATSGGDTLKPGHWPRMQNELLAALVALRGQAVSERSVPADLQTSKHTDTVGDIQRYLASHLAQPLRLDDIAHLVRLSPNHINAVFREHTGQTIHAWLIGERMKKSMSLCTETDMPFKDIAAAVGFQNALYFSRAFRRAFDMSPTQARGNHNAAIAGA